MLNTRGLQRLYCDSYPRYGIYRAQRTTLSVCPHLLSCLGQGILLCFSVCQAGWSVSFWRSFCVRLQFCINTLGLQICTMACLPIWLMGNWIQILNICEAKALAFEASPPPFFWVAWSHIIRVPAFYVRIHGCYIHELRLLPCLLAGTPACSLWGSYEISDFKNSSKYLYILLAIFILHISY